MDNITEDRETAIELMNEILAGAIFYEFTFNTSFILKFSRSEKRTFKGKDIPSNFNLILLDDWEFEGKEPWEKHIDKDKLINADEAVCAYKLAALRWSEESFVEKVFIHRDKTSIRFKNGKEIIVHQVAEMDYSWELHEANTDITEQHWSIICEDNVLYTKFPL